MVWSTAGREYPHRQSAGMNGEDMDWIFSALALVTACTGAWLDLKTHKIPNRLTVTAMGSGLILRLVFLGLPGVLYGLAGFCMASLFLLLWLSGALKAGDIKLYMAIGVLGGWRLCLNAAVYSIMLGGIVGLCLMAAKKNGRQAMKHLKQYFLSIFLTRKFYMYQGEPSSYFCFGICIAGGTLAAIFRQIL